MKELKRNEINALLRFMKSKKYVIYSRPYEMNIIGRRTDNKRPNRFDDFIYVLYTLPSGRWVGYESPATTDTGTYYLKNPMNPEGTAMLKEGQYLDAYVIGKHRGVYDAVVQKKPVTVIRDYNRDGVLDVDSGKEDTGLFGINIHRASSDGITKYIDKFSAGCQVFSNINDYIKFMAMSFRHSNMYGNKFTYTLIDEREFMRKLRRRLVVTGVTLIAISVVSFAIYTFFKLKNK